MSRPRAAARKVPREPAPPTTAHCPVVGIGASAGGLEALQDLLSHVGRTTGMAFVVVQHLDPTHESLLSEILGRASEMPCRQAADGLHVEADHVYVIPPNREMTIQQGRLRLGKRPRRTVPHLPVDCFFRSLAEDCGAAAIGVVLSGTSSDGMHGLKAIKQVGGITFAQDEQSAKYPEMPRSAVASGAVDLVMPPQGIARELARLRKHAYALLQPEVHVDEVPAGDAQVLDRILARLRAVTGADFSYYKQSTIRRRILRRMALARVERLEDYATLLQGSREEVAALYDDVLINVTSFFRDPAAFKALRRRVLPALFRKRRADSRVRIWIPGCSSGEEVYSIAICVFEHLASRKAAAQVQIFGTDLSETVVDRARQGRYPGSIASDVPEDLLRRYFTPAGDGWQVAKPLRDACVFAKHNLLRDPPFSKIDLVSCRNVLIYFGSALQKKALSLFHYALKPDGFLMLGTAEHIGSFSDLFTLADKKHKIYVKKPVPSRLHFGPSEPGGVEEPGPAEGPREGDARALDIQREADRLVMSRYVPAGLVVDENLDILQFRGHTGPYLESRPGTASLNLLKMAREGLLVELRAAFQRARKEGKPVKRQGVLMRTDEGRLVEVTLEVLPFTLRQNRSRLYLVLFEGVASGRQGSAPGAAKGRKRAGGSPSAAERELAATKEYLQTIIEEQEATNEELMSANEEILSSNEELQSTNEELETAKEELQSSNEELSTVNDELSDRNAELSDLNNDLHNLLGTIHIPMLILDADLRIRRATPSAERLLNLIASDVGRRVTDLRPNIDLGDIEGMVKQVVERMEPRDLEVRDHGGRWYAMRVRPYKTADHKVGGVVITWIDTEAARAQGQKAARGLARELLDLLAVPAAILSADLRVDSANARWRDAFGSGPRDGPLAWGDDTLLVGLRKALEGGAAVEGHRASIRAGGPARLYRLGGVALPGEGGDASLLVTAAPV